MGRTSYGRGTPADHGAKLQRRINLFASHGFLGLRFLQADLSFTALVQLFDPLLSPRCYAVVGLKTISP